MFIIFSTLYCNNSILISCLYIAINIGYNFLRNGYQDTITIISSILQGLIIISLIVLLIGLASKNAILIVEFTLDYRKRGYDIITSSIDGAKERFRAVLMTASTFILGVLPMVIASGAGAASQISMGTSVFFGMIFATSFGIIFIPVLFAFFDGIIEKFSKNKNIIKEK